MGRVVLVPDAERAPGAGLALAVALELELVVLPILVVRVVVLRVSVEAVDAGRERVELGFLAVVGLNPPDAVRDVLEAKEDPEA